MAEQLFYVQDMRQIVGNCVSWWCPEGKGYTCELDKAGLYTAEQVKDMRDSDKPWPREVVEAAAIRHVRSDHLRQVASLLAARKEHGDG